MIEEIEIKFAVDSKQGLAALEKRAREIFPSSTIKQVEQTNFFFDTREFAVRKKGIGLRLRKQDEYYFMTIKGPNGGKDSAAQKLTSRLEFETPIDDSSAAALLDGTKNPISVVESISIQDTRMKATRDHLLSVVHKAVSKHDVALVGSFRNQRRMLPIEIDNCKMKLEFDETRFLESVIHYEVELEIPSMEHFDAAEAFLIDLFKQCGLKAGYQKSKSERFYAILRAR